MAYAGAHIRDQLAPLYRRMICEEQRKVPFPHQADWWLAADGYELTDKLVGYWTKDDLVSGKYSFDWEPGITQDVMLEDESIERREVLPRTLGPARVVFDLVAYKGGKSWSAGVFVASELMIPGVLWDLVGVEYSICEPEFDYVAEMLFSEDGLNIPLMKKGGRPGSAHLWGNFQRRPRAGVMVARLSNGSILDCKSWERSEALKGKERDGYMWCEAYQFGRVGGIECYTSVKQNLRARNGKSLNPTTPDLPWVEEGHSRGHNDQQFPDWYCVCSIGREQNPYTFDAIEKEKDRAIMTSEKFQIAWEGRLGQYVGTVFDYQRGERFFDAESHPQLFKDPLKGASYDNLQIPEHWEVVAGADTGNFYSALFCAFDQDGNCYVLMDLPNYRYVAGQIERDENVSMTGWYEAIKRVAHDLGGRPYVYADKNAQFKQDAFDHGVRFLPGSMPETRTEIARSYFQHDRIFFAPWTDTIQFEVEHATFPAHETSTGAWRRIKQNDHTLDGLEHVLAARPIADATTPPKKTLAIEKLLNLRPQAQIPGRKSPWGV